MCRLVAKSTEKSPPHLHARPRLPVYPVGDWVSSSCETRPIGTFLLRRMKFSDHSHGKSEEYLIFFKDRFFWSFIIKKVGKLEITFLDFLHISYAVKRYVIPRDSVKL